MTKEKRLQSLKLLCGVVGVEPTVLEFQKYFNNTMFVKWKSLFGTSLRHPKLVEDGQLGPITYEAVLLVYDYITASQTPLVGLSSITTCSSTYSTNGYKSAKVRSDPDIFGKFSALVSMAQSVGAELPTSGGIRNPRVTSKPAKGASPSRSAVSYHYLGRAVDFYVGGGFSNPNKDNYVVCPPTANDLYAANAPYVVYARCKSLHPMFGASRLVGAHRVANKVQTTPVSGTFFNLSAAAESLGIKQIRPRGSWRNGDASIYGLAEWWHFQVEAPLGTTFLKELVHTFPARELANTDVWSFRRYICTGPTFTDEEI